MTYRGLARERWPSSVVAKLIGWLLSFAGTVAHMCTLFEVLQGDSRTDDGAPNLREFAADEQYPVLHQIFASFLGGHFGLQMFQRPVPGDRV